jgi:hypothetical protein
MTEHTQGVLWAQDLSGRYMGKYLHIEEPGEHHVAVTLLASGNVTYVRVPSPHWQEIVMIQHKKNGFVKVRTTFPGGSSYEREFGGSDLVEVAEAVAL